VLPNLIVIGAMKCGTSSLHHYLSLHPEIFMSAEKELNFFERSWDRGLPWYEAQFSEPAAVRGESSPNYTKYPRHGRETPERMHSVVPDARLIYLVRDPVERILSHYVDALAFGRVSRPLVEELAGPEGEHFVNTSRYFMQLSRYLDFYERSQILLLTSEELKTQRQAALQRVFRFLQVDDSYWNADYERALNPGREKRRSPRFGYVFEKVARRTRGSRVRRLVPRGLARPIRALAGARSSFIEPPEIDDPTRAALAERLQDDVSALRTHTGEHFRDWSI
jgi:hypothetical protein